LTRWFLQGQGSDEGLKLFLKKGFSVSAGVLRSRLKWKKQRVFNRIGRVYMLQSSFWVEREGCFMVRAAIAGSGSCIPPNRVTNDMLSRIMDAGDDWIRERSGVETRYYVDEGTATSDLGAAAAVEALKTAGMDKDDLDLIIFATMTPDHFFPGCGGLLQAKLGIKNIPCFDIRQQCAGFLYGMQLADAQIRSGMAKNVLLVGAEVHTGFMPWTAENYLYLCGKPKQPRLLKSTPGTRASAM
jgi:3-oxoacyl-(acyl-carrier-protein) synthase III